MKITQFTTASPISLESFLVITVTSYAIKNLPWFRLNLLSTRNTSVSQTTEPDPVTGVEGDVLMGHETTHQF